MEKKPTNFPLLIFGGNEISIWLSLVAGHEQRASRFSRLEGQSALSDWFFVMHEVRRNAPAFLRASLA